MVRTDNIGHRRQKGHPRVPLFMGTTPVNSYRFMPSRWHWSCTFGRSHRQDFWRVRRCRNSADHASARWSLLAPAPAHADVNVGIRVAPQTLAAPPHLVAVLAAPSSSRPARLARCSSIAAATIASTRHLVPLGWPGNSWSLIAADRVPNAVLAVPTVFAKAPRCRQRRLKTRAR